MSEIEIVADREKNAWRLSAPSLLQERLSLSTEAEPRLLVTL